MSRPSAVESIALTPVLLVIEDIADLDRAEADQRFDEIKALAEDLGVKVRFAMVEAVPAAEDAEAHRRICTKIQILSSFLDHEKYRPKVNGSRVETPHALDPGTLAESAETPEDRAVATGIPDEEIPSVTRYFLISREDGSVAYCLENGTELTREIWDAKGYKDSDDLLEMPPLEEACSHVLLYDPDMEDKVECAASLAEFYDIQEDHIFFINLSREPILNSSYLFSFGEKLNEMKKLVDCLPSSSFGVDGGPVLTLAAHFARFETFYNSAYETHALLCRQKLAYVFSNMHLLGDAILSFDQQTEPFLKEIWTRSVSVRGGTETQSALKKAVSAAGFIKPPKAVCFDPSVAEKSPTTPVCSPDPKFRSR